MMFVIRKMYNSFDLNNYKVVLIVDRKRPADADVQDHENREVCGQYG